MAETLYELNNVDKKEEANDEEERLPSVLYQKSPWRADIYTHKWWLSTTTKDTLQIYARLNRQGHGHKKYTMDPWEKLNHDKCNH